MSSPAHMYLALHDDAGVDDGKGASLRLSALTLALLLAFAMPIAWMSADVLGIGGPKVAFAQDDDGDDDDEDDTDDDTRTSTRSRTATRTGDTGVSTKTRTGTRSRSATRTKNTGVSTKPQTATRSRSATRTKNTGRSTR